MARWTLVAIVIGLLLCIVVQADEPKLPRGVKTELKKDVNGYVLTGNHRWLLFEGRSTALHDQVAENMTWVSRMLYRQARLEERIEVLERQCKVEPQPEKHAHDWQKNAPGR